MNYAKKVIKRGKKQGFTNLEMARIRQVADEAGKRAELIAKEKAFIYMLAIPINILVHDYWSKSAKKKIPEFIDKTMSLFDSIDKGIVTDEELIDLIKEYTGTTIEVEWDRRRKKQDVS